MTPSTNQSGDSVGVLQRMMRRIQLATGWGRVTFSDDSKTAQLLQVKLNDSETRDGTPRIAEFGFTSHLPKGSDVLMVFLGGDRSKGVVVATAHQGSRPTNLLEGESMVYDLWGKSIYLTETGGIIVEAGAAPVTVNNATTVTINAAESVQMNTPVLRVSGDIEAGGNIKDKVRTMAADRELFNQHTNGTGTTTPEPSTMSDITTTWVVETGTGDWSVLGGALASGNDLASAVLISLFTDRIADGSDIPPDGSGDRRGWWGDADEDISIGSRLWLLDRSRLTQDVANSAKIYMEEALQWLIDDQVALSVTVVTAIAGGSRLNSIVTVTHRDGTVTPLNFNWVWNQTSSP